MDFQHRPGGKYGQGVMMSRTEVNTDVKERQRKLMLDTIDLSKDPYIYQNHLGSYECRLCCTAHINIGSYIAHTKGKKHQTNLQRRLAHEMKDQKQIIKPKLTVPKNNIIRIGTPAYNIKKEIDSVSRQRVLKFEIFYNQILDKTKPDHRIISAFEQKMENPDDNYLYLLFAADPYETICVKIPNSPLDDTEEKNILSHTNI